MDNKKIIFYTSFIGFYIFVMVVFEILLKASFNFSVEVIVQFSIYIFNGIIIVLFSLTDIPKRFFNSFFIKLPIVFHYLYTIAFFLAVAFCSIKYLIPLMKKGHEPSK